MLLLGGVIASQDALAQTASSQNGSTHARKSIRAIATSKPLLIDGSLEESEWAQAPVANGFIQKDPREAEAATEKTEFQILYTPTVLYIGVKAFDSNPQGIIASERRRDGDLQNDDSITIVLDTFHDHRNSYKFTTNPLGTQQDALVTDEGNNTNENWDEKWDVAARITSDGWTAEFAIPFKSVRVPESDGAMVWGFDMQRFIRRKNESTSWVNYRRGFEIASVSQAGHLSGLEAIETGLHLRIKPYLLGGFSQSVRKQSNVPPGADPFRKVTTDASNYGIEVMKYRITPSLTSDFTWRTDFAQTEVDNQQINLDRFPLFFPEKREFFQEGAGIFEFGTAEDENGGAETKVFHSRTIGLTPGTRQPIPIKAGGRITGKIHGFGVGLMNVQTERYAPENIPAGNYSVARIKRDVLRRSSIGAFFLNHELGGTDDYNRVAGADANFVFYRYLSMGGFVGKAYHPIADPNQEHENWITAAVVRWNSDQFNIETSWHSVSKNFRDDMGFIPRPDQHLFAPQIAYRPRIDGKIIRQLVFRSRVDYIMNASNHLETRTGHNAFEINFQDGGNLAWTPHTRFDTFYTPFNLRRGVVQIQPGSYSWWNNGIRYSPSSKRRISGQVINWQWHIGYYGSGTLHNISFNPRIRVNSQISAQIGYTIAKVNFPDDRLCVVKDAEPGCGFTDHLVNARLNYNLNNNWLTSTVVQYNNADHFWGYNLRLDYIYRPGDDVFFIYNEGRQIEGPLHYANAGEKERTVQLKITHSFDF